MNIEEYTDEDGNEYEICGCMRCRNARRKAAYDEAREDDDRYYRRGLL